MIQEVESWKDGMGPPPSHQTLSILVTSGDNDQGHSAGVGAGADPQKIDGFGWSNPKHSHSFPQTFHDIPQVLKTNPLILERIFYMTGTKTMVSSKFSFGQDLEAVTTWAKLHDPLKD